MRPSELIPLFRQVSSLKGVGEQTLKALKRLLNYHSLIEQDHRDSEPVLRDLLFHLPSGIVDRRKLVCVGEMETGSIATTIITVQSHHAPPRTKGRKPPYKVICSDETGELLLTFFNPRADYLSSQLPVGQKRLISGRVERFDGLPQISHPDIIAHPDKREEVARLEPNYPLTYAISQKMVQKLIRQAVPTIPTLSEWIDPALQRQRNWPGFRECLTRIHTPQGEDDLAHQSAYFSRLAYDEILANQLALAMIRQRTTRQTGITINGEGSLSATLRQALPFMLTQGQELVLSEILSDMKSGNRMLRLLQGDVGSGKTVVALMSMMPLIAMGYQAALMVPTEILGQQHLRTISKLVEPLGLRAEILTGKRTAAERKRILADLASGEIHILIGTHALFQEQVTFANLGYVVIDEQHRFGVNQRLALSSKGVQPHVLLMTATPIPRSLTMTAYGDMDGSALTEKPANRPQIDTRAVPLSRIDEVVGGMKRAIAEGAKVYWICPLVEESSESLVPKEDEGDLAAAEERFRVFQSIFGDRVGLAHGKMKAPKRQAAMQAFAAGGHDILVATTVVEVGVDVPEATIIVIEHAERFGLAQLHQLRGRVGRGSKPSTCVLLYNPRCSEVAKKRLSIIRECTDGFRIAEEDLMLRGAGDVLGTRQSGLPDFRFIDLALHRDLVLTARDDVKLILHKDPQLQSTRGHALRSLLYLFDYDSSLRYLQAG